MAYGGSNLGYMNNDEGADSYDYGAAVGQAGDLRPIYYRFKRMGWWARSFAEILENSEDATEDWKGAVVDNAGMSPAGGKTDTAVTVTARHSPAGDVIFLDNHSGNAIPAHLAMKQGAGLSAWARLALGGALSLAPGEIFPVVHHFAMDSLVTLEWAPVRMLGISGQGNITTMVIYGEAGSPAELYFNVRGNAIVLKGGDARSVGAAQEAGGQQVVLQAKFSDARTPVEYVFSVGGKKWRILAVNSRLADRTWFLESAGRHSIVCGPDYVGDMPVKSGELPTQQGRMDLVAEFPWQESAEYPVWLYGDRPAPVPLKAGEARMGQAIASRRTGKLSLTPWQFRTGVSPAGRGYYDNDWKYSGQPLQMGADGDGTADAWYRTTLHTDEAGMYTLQVEGGDRATAFVDGVPAGTGDIRGGEITFNLSRGQHVLAFFTAHDGRDKLAAYLGAMDSVDRKGLFGKAILRKGGPSIVTLGGWKFLKAEAGADSDRSVFPATGTTGWRVYAIGSGPL